jgi:hypothetical protein
LFVDLFFSGTLTHFDTYHLVVVYSICNRLQLQRTSESSIIRLDFSKACEKKN